MNTYSESRFDDAKRTEELNKEMKKKEINTLMENMTVNELLFLKKISENIKSVITTLNIFSFSK